MTKTIEVTDDQLRTLIGAMYDKLVESKRYRTNSEVPDVPRESDLCCAEHRMRYERNREIFLYLRARVADEEELVALLESVEKEPSPREVLEKRAADAAGAIFIHNHTAESRKQAEAEWHAATAALEKYDSEHKVANQEEVDRHAEKQGVSYKDAWRYFEREGYDMSRVAPQYS